MKKTILTYMGKDGWNRPIYKVGDTSTYVKDVNLGYGAPGLCWSCPSNDPDGEPDADFLPDGELCFIGREDFD